MSHAKIEAENLSIGKNTIIHPSAVIRGVSGEAKNIFIGDNCYIGENVQIICDEFSIGDYSKVHHHTNIHGYLPCKIGHNAWIGQYTIIDSIGGTTIGDNCGIGAHSQLWSHIKYLQVGNDVWFVGHCIVSPIVAEDKSMAMVGSVITKDMSYNKIYAGSPAKEISEKVGPQFEERSLKDKFERMVEYLNDFGQVDQIKIVLTPDEVIFNDNCSYFVISDRKYKKTLSESEIAFMKYLLPAKAKFTPY
jgi:acetyltransferase-like isoleucine patch superfamily enzyme